LFIHQMELYDVIIVGAGISGLTAGYHLLSVAPDLRVIVLEAKDRVGGRTLTTDLKSATGTDRWDLGGQWVSVSQPHIMDLLLELGLDTYPQYLRGTKLLQLTDGAIREYKGSIPKLSILSLLDLRWFIYKFEKLCHQIDVNNPYNHPNAAELDSTTVEKYENSVLFTKETKEAIDIAIRTTLGCEASNMSLLFLLMYAKSAGGLMPLFEATHGSAQESRVKGGTQQISECLVDKIGKSSVKLSSPVTAIHQTSDVTGDVSLEVMLQNGEKINGKYVIMAIPLQLVSQIDFKPQLPERAQILMSSMPMGHLTKYICTYSKAFWRNKGFSGEIVSNGGPKLIDGCDSGPLGVVYDATTYKGSPALVGFLGGNQGTQWTSKPFEMRKFAILRALSQFFGEEALSPVDFAEKNWTNEPYTGGCPVNVASTGVMQHMHDSLKTPFGRVHWAGTETATAWRGYMSGAVQSGRRAAKEVLFHLRPMNLTTQDLQETFYATKHARKHMSNSASRFLHYLLATILGGMIVFYMIQVVE